jgi:hypothetical protein
MGRADVSQNSEFKRLMPAAAGAREDSRVSTGGGGISMPESLKHWSRPLLQGKRKRSPLGSGVHFM